MHSFIFVAFLITCVQGHIAAWHKGMYCLNGTTGVDNPNGADPVPPLYQLDQADWWFHHINKCDEFPPAPGDFLELPAGKSFTVELANNRAYTSLSYNGAQVTAWPNGGTYPDDYSVNTPGATEISPDGCIGAPNLHAQNESMAAGTAFAISYVSELKDVTPENLVVFSVRLHTPFKMVTSYDVPAAMPACPAEGCICAWGWVPDGCGQANMYMGGFRCKVTGATSTVPVAVAKPAVWCELDQSNCTVGAKQMLYFNQKTGTNIVVDGYQADGRFKFPGYNNKMGFPSGAQNDIFQSSVGAATTAATSKLITSTASASSTASISSTAVTSAAVTTSPIVNVANTTSLATSSATNTVLATTSVSVTSVATSSANATSTESPSTSATTSHRIHSTCRPHRHGKRTRFVRRH